MTFRVISGFHSIQFSNCVALRVANCDLIKPKACVVSDDTKTNGVTLNFALRFGRDPRNASSMRLCLSSIFG